MEALRGEHRKAARQRDGGGGDAAGDRGDPPEPCIPSPDRPPQGELCAIGLHAACRSRSQRLHSPDRIA